MGFIGLILICIGAIIIFMVDDVDSGMIIGTFISGIGIGMFISDIYFHDEGPKAIDVYRGKTTLQITYKNEIPIDTIVVFK